MMQGILRRHALNNPNTSLELKHAIPPVVISSTSIVRVAIQFNAGGATLPARDSV
jgi:hypothetical protein